MDQETEDFAARGEAQNLAARTKPTARGEAQNPDASVGVSPEHAVQDRLGSGIRNLYKYCRSYGGGDPVFTEGNDFVISVPLHKLDSVRFSFEKPSIAAEKPSIGGEKPSIATEKPSIRHVLSGLKLSRPTHDNILVLYGALADGEVFGRSRVMAVTNLTNGPAGNLINVMLRNKLLVTVVGQGKGKYRFRSFDEEDSTHAH